MRCACSRLVGAGLAALFVAWTSPALAGAIVTSAAGPNAASIQGTVDSFRAALGNPNNGNAPGPLPVGHREINWDGAPPTTNTALVGNPFAGFLNTRGALFTTPGTGFIQATPAGMAANFMNSDFGTDFKTFSDPRLFAPIGSNVHDATFFIPGTAGQVPATVSGFGAVFTDVEQANTSSLQFFGADGNSLGVFAVPPFDNGLSFLGVIFDAGERITRVRITSGTAALGNASGQDFVALDDFIFAEPRVVPEPSTLALLGLAGLTWGLARKAWRRAGRDGARTRAPSA